MAGFFQKPRPCCVGRILNKHVTVDCLPTKPEVSAQICEKHLGSKHSLPRFFKLRAKAQSRVGQNDLRFAYNKIHEHYDQFWLKEAAKPVIDLVSKLALNGSERVYEAGCGTGFATALIAEKLTKSGTILAVDISEGMIGEARKRLEGLQIVNVRLMTGDALEVLGKEGVFDIVLSTWALGYIPLQPFFMAARGALLPHGRIAFVVHKENSPRQPLEIFAEIVAADPSVLKKKVWFDFPHDMEQVETIVGEAGLEVERLWDGKVKFRFNRPEEVLDHLLKSGAGTAYHEAVDPKRRKILEKEFLQRLVADKTGGTREVIHDYVACIARRGDS
jgi:protein-L-isoaspartate O-methyltransferase